MPTETAPLADIFAVILQTLLACVAFAAVLAFALGGDRDPQNAAESKREKPKAPPILDRRRPIVPLRDPEATRRKIVAQARSLEALRPVAGPDGSVKLRVRT